MGIFDFLKKKKNGLCTRTKDNTKLVAYYEDDIMHGDFKIFRLNTPYGDYLFQEGTYIHGKLHGESKKYLRGIIHSIENYNNGVLHGDYIEYHFGSVHNALSSVFGSSYQKERKDLIHQKGTYINGKKEGLWTTYQEWENQPLESEKEFKNGMIHGFSRTYDVDVKNNHKIYLSSECFYKNNKLEGAYKEFYRTGKLKRKTIYENGNEI